MLFLANEENKLAELTKPAEESLKRLVRNPDAINHMVENFTPFGGKVAQRMFQQVAQTAPEFSRTFGQALSEALAQTTALAQIPPGNFNLSQFAPKIPESFNLGQLGQRMSQSFLFGAAPNLFSPQNDPSTKETEPVTVAGKAAGTDATAEATPTVGQPNPFIGHPLLPPYNFGLPGLSFIRPLRLFNPLVPSASEISEVRVRPDNSNPYKLTLKEVDHTTMNKMRLKALLSEALAKKTIPILWFHLPGSHDVHKSPEDLETEEKLKIFEKQVIADLEQLQELSKLANELKTAQLQSGSQPTPSLMTKLNLSEIPVYDITVGDIEKTLEDEHVIMLMHSFEQNQKKKYHRHHQATTKYLTDLTGNPIKRQTTADDVLQNMEKDDMLKLMTYAYRMGSMNGQVPWLKKELSTSNVKENGQNTHLQVTMEAGKQAQINNERKPIDTQQWTDQNSPQKLQSMMMDSKQMMAEKQWIEDKQRQMAMEAENQMNMYNDRRSSVGQQNNFATQMPNQMNTQRQLPQSQSMMGNTEMGADKQWLVEKQRQMAMEAGMQTNMNDKRWPINSGWVDQNPTTPPNIATEMNMQGQVQQNQLMMGNTEHNMLPQMLIQNPMTPSQMPAQTAIQRQNPQPMLSGPSWTDINKPRQMIQSQMPPQMQTQMPQKMSQMMPPQMLQSMAIQQQMINPHVQRQMMHQPSITNFNMQPQAFLQRQSSSIQMPQQQQQQPIMISPMAPQIPQLNQQQMTAPNVQPLIDVTEQRRTNETNIKDPSDIVTADQKPEQQAVSSTPDDLNNNEQKPEQNQVIDTKSFAIPQGQWGAFLPEPNDTNPTIDEIIPPQTLENADRARFGGKIVLIFRYGFLHSNLLEHLGLHNLFPKFDIFNANRRKGKHEKPTVINYYYNTGGSRYPPTFNSGYQIPPPPPSYPLQYYGPQQTASPSYYQGPPLASKSKPLSSLYGGGGFGSNAYGSYGGHYRAAVGDDEIAAMLREHQLLPVRFLFTLYD